MVCVILSGKWLARVTCKAHVPAWAQLETLVFCILSQSTLSYILLCQQEPNGYQVLLCNTEAHVTASAQLVTLVVYILPQRTLSCINNIVLIATKWVTSITL